MKNYSAWLSSILVLVLLLSGCGGNNSNTKAASNTNSTTGRSDKPVELKMMYMVFNVPKDINLVEDELNKLLQEKINVKVDLVPIQLTSYNQQLNLVMTSGEKMDLIMTGYMGNTLTYSQQVAKGELLPMDDLLKKMVKVF